MRAYKGGRVSEDASHPIRRGFGRKRAEAEMMVELLA
jgi:hypothetical protein